MNPYAKYYDYWESGVEGDLAFILEELKTVNGPVLDIGCGTGRLAIPVAQRRRHTIGIDICPDMIHIANKKRQESKAKQWLQFFEYDMRSFRLHQQFSLIIVAYRTFMHLHTKRDQLNVLRRIRDHLLPTGKAIISFINPTQLLLPELSAFGGPMVHLVDSFQIPGQKSHIVIISKTEYLQRSNRLRITFIFNRVYLSSGKKHKEYHSFEYRIIYPDEMKNRIHESGLNIKALYGNFQRASYHENCSELVWVIGR